MTHPPALKEQARALRQQGLLIKDIARQVPVPMPTLIRWLNPELEFRERARAKKAKFSQKRRCPTCKKKMSNNAALCRVCFHRQQKYWTSEKVVEAIQRWAIEQGAPPSYQEWLLSGPGHPALWTIISGNNPAFSSWSEALQAAGFEPRKRRRKMTPLDRQARAKMRRKAREDAIRRALTKENA
jgi:transposase